MKRLVLLSLVLLMLVAGCGERTHGMRGETSTTKKPNEQLFSSSTAATTVHTHKWIDASCVNPKTCSCGATAGSALGHQYSSATCTSPKICTRCGTVEGVELGHDYASANCYLPKTCKRCGGTSGDPLGHKYVNGKCSRCNSLDPDVQVSLFDISPFDQQNTVSVVADIYDTYGNYYEKCLRFGDRNNWFTPDPVVTYRLSGTYTTFEGMVGFWDSSKDGWKNDEYMSGNLTIKIYKEDELVYIKDSITKWTEPVSFKVDVSGCNFLKIEVRNTIDEGYAYLLLGNALLKK